ncbi:MAG TPA: hypothetical protein VEA59_05050 [Patescibacteria group bacterium]|nr:hypothetical protein [Patescibacteria group bacterium]
MKIRNVSLLFVVLFVSFTAFAQGNSSPSKEFAEGKEVMLDAVETKHTLKVIDFRRVGYALTGDKKKAEMKANISGDKAPVQAATQNVQLEFALAPGDSPEKAVLSVAGPGVGVRFMPMASQSGPVKVKTSYEKGLKLNFTQVGTVINNGLDYTVWRASIQLQPGEYFFQTGPHTIFEFGVK